MKNKALKEIIETMIFGTIGLIALFLFALLVHTHSNAYTIKDTVYIAPMPDSITVTMSMEEWNQVEAQLSIDWDALSDVVWEVDPDSEEFWESLTLPPPRGIPGIPPHRIAKEVKR